MATVAELIAEREIASGFASSKPLELLSTPEKRRRYQQLKDKMHRSKLKVDGKLGVHYFWAGLEDRNEMARLEGLGYSIVREPNASEVLAGKATASINANGLKEDGTFVVGDVILTSCSQEDYEMIMLANSERHEELATGATRDFKAEAEQHAVPVFDHIK